MGELRYSHRKEGTLGLCVLCHYGGVSKIMTHDLQIGFSVEGFLLQAVVDTLFNHQFIILSTGYEPGVYHCVL
jgi:hypothetical protein